MLWNLILVLIGSYVIGCFVAAYYVTRLRRGVDIRSSVSVIAGARIWHRVYVMTDAVITLLIDSSK